jgi:chromosome segregation ATPase
LQQLNAELQRKLTDSEKDRQEMARTFGKHRSARTAIQAKYNVCRTELVRCRESLQTTDDRMEAQNKSQNFLLETTKKQLNAEIMALKMRFAATGSTLDKAKERIADLEKQVLELKRQVLESERLATEAVNNVEKSEPYLQLKALDDELTMELERVLSQYYQVLCPLHSAHI